MKKSKNLLRIERWLSKIGYTLKHHGCGYYYIYDHEDDITEWFIFGEVDTRIELHTKKSFQYNCTFYLKDVKIYALKTPKKEVDCVGFQPKNQKGVFLQFYNHTKK